MIPRTQLFLLLLAFSLALVACGGQASAPQPAIENKLAPVSALPPELQDAPAEVKEAYRFAIANKELLKQIPCFCGCVAVGHKSNYSCYVADDGGPGDVVKFDSHAAG